MAGKVNTSQFRVGSLLLWTALIAVYCGTFPWVQQPEMRLYAFLYWALLVAYSILRFGEAASLLVCMALGALGTLLCLGQMDTQLRSYSEYVGTIATLMFLGSIIAATFWFAVGLPVTLIQHLGPPLARLLGGQKPPVSDAQKPSRGIQV